MCQKSICSRHKCLRSGRGVALTVAVLYQVVDLREKSSNGLMFVPKLALHSHSLLANFSQPLQKVPSTLYRPISYHSQSGQVSSHQPRRAITIVFFVPVKMSKSNRHKKPYSGVVVGALFIKQAGLLQ